MSISSNNDDVVISITSIILYHIISFGKEEFADSIENILGKIQVYQSLRISAFRLVGIEEREKDEKKKNL